MSESNEYSNAQAPSKTAVMPAVSSEDDLDSSKASASPSAVYDAQATTLDDETNAFIDSVEDSEAAELSNEDDSMLMLPFGYAKRTGILFIDERFETEQERRTAEQHAEESGVEADSRRRVICREDVHIDAIIEARRVIGGDFSIEYLDAEQFEIKLTDAYQRDSSEARQLMEDIGNEADLYTLAEELPETEDLLENDDDAPVIKLINAMLSEAIKEGASDVHIETFEKDLKVRFRIDGVLREILKPNRKMASLLVSRIKVMAKLDIAEKRVPQDGRISLLIGGRAVDVRVSTMPSNHGERVVLRLLDKNNACMSLDDLGMTEHNCTGFANLLKKPHGIILVTGPTGSGKSTTLYAGLSDLNSSERNILTVEDPIEYALEGVGQTQVNTKVDMTFARGLRAILRQDPDVVMIGEIRDLETAQIAVQASLTGHLVLSTLHTNTAAGAITRLEDMGLEPFLLSSSVLAVLAQRLVRTLCKECKQPVNPTKREREALGLSETEPATIYHPVGCEHCKNSGYRGRAGIHELLTVDEEVRELIHNGAGEQAIEKQIRSNTPSIRHDGCTKVLEGITSLEEVIRVTREG